MDLPSVIKNVQRDFNDIMLLNPVKACKSIKSEVEVTDFELFDEGFIGNQQGCTKLLTQLHVSFL